MNKILQSRLYKAIFFSLLIISVGTSGYMLFFNYSFVDALYMTIITITTIGFGEVHPFDTGEKLFTIGLILSSLFTFGYAVSSFSEYLISGQFFKQLKQRRVQQQIEKLEGHCIVCGYGRNGKQAIATLKNHGRELVVVEQDKKLIEELEHENVLMIEGDATSDEVLLKAGLEKASSLITALPSDADNLFVVLTTKQLNKGCKIISRASNESSYKKLKFAGADNVIMPDKLGGGHMASLVVTPDIVEFVDRLTFEGEAHTNLKEIAVNDLPKEYVNKTILDLDLRKRTGCTAIGFKKSNGDYIINPDASTELQKDTFLILLGRTEQIERLQEIF